MVHFIKKQAKKVIKIINWTIIGLILLLLYGIINLAAGAKYLGASLTLPKSIIIISFIAMLLVLKFNIKKLGNNKKYQTTVINKNVSISFLIGIYIIEVLSITSNYYVQNKTNSIFSGFYNPLIAVNTILIIIALISIIFLLPFFNKAINHYALISYIISSIFSILMPFAYTNAKIYISGIISVLFFSATIITIFVVISLLIACAKDTNLL